MPAEFVDYGEGFSGLNPAHFSLPIAKKTLQLCIESESYDVIELRHIQSSTGETVDIIVVDCINDQVPSRNTVGVKVRERLALIFQKNKAPEVRALRKDFPVVPHLNHVPPDEPASLCLYFQTWSAVERTWTPQKYLQRILWWLSETAKNTLHAEDQPLEPIYFESPFEIVLPPDYEEKIKDPSLALTFSVVPLTKKEFKVIRGCFWPAVDIKQHHLPNIEIIIIDLPPIVHGVINYHPNSLGQLHDQYFKHGADFIGYLCDFIKKRAQNGIENKPTQHCLLILNTPFKRTNDVQPEKIEVHAFFLMVDLTVLGKAVGILKDGRDGKFYAIPILGDSPKEDMEWKGIEVLPIELKKDLDKVFARELSGVAPASADFQGVLLGVGALGSALAELWSKERWGEWTFVDPDIVKSHNVVRHISRNSHIGYLKVDIVKTIVENNFHPGCYQANAIADRAANWENDDLKNSILGSTLVVDTTTTLDVPREFSQLDEVPRSCSMFLIPSGEGAVMMLEDQSRELRLEALEAQYYRGILNSEWGKTHLIGHQGKLWVGAGCRDVSAVISNESIQLSAATLARQLRLIKGAPEASIRIWTAEKQTGSFLGQAIKPAKANCLVRSGWRVIWDAEIQQKLVAMRYSQLPNETGGVILGYIDNKLLSIYVVDVLPAPYDSDADLTGFTRGVHELNEILDNTAKLTANIVGYIGEWHSHPEFTSAKPSSKDWDLIKEISAILARDGQPALMVIIGSGGDLSLTVRGN